VSLLTADWEQVMARAVILGAGIGAEDTALAERAA
jgi:hypothetical protein